MATNARDKLKNLTGTVPARCFGIDIPHPMVAEIAGRVGPELAVVDCEHGQIGPERAADMLRALDLTGTPALVRLGDAGAGRVKHALDAGAAGVMIPYVETVEEAHAAIRAFYTPPLGARGTATIVTRAGGFGADPDYVRDWNATGLLALQIESGRGLAAASEIAALPGADMLFFGPYDYATDRRLDPADSDAALMEAFRAMTVAANAAGKLSGAFPWPGIAPAALLAEGADLVAVASDPRGLMQGLRAGLDACPL